VAIAETTTPSRLRRRARRIVDAALSAPLQQRHDAAREERHVRLHELPDGMCEVAARMPALLGAAILDRLTQAARALPADDPRTIDQRRVDALAELLLCGQAPDDAHAASAITPVVTITIPATALLADDGAAEPDAASLDGRMLVDPATARAIAAGATGWDRLFLSPVTGRALAVDRYRPSAAQRRWLRARDGRCRFPGCGAPAHRTDADHTRDHAHGGPTADGNLAHLCRRHHTIKHATRWRVRQLPGGVLEWTSPTGTTLTDEPEPPPRARIPNFHDREPATTGAPPGDPHLLTLRRPAPIITPAPHPAVAEGAVARRPPVPPAGPARRPHPLVEERAAAGGTRLETTTARHGWSRDGSALRARPPRPAKGGRPLDRLPLVEERAAAGGIRHEARCRPIRWSRSAPPQAASVTRPAAAPSAGRGARRRRRHPSRGPLPPHPLVEERAAAGGIRHEARCPTLRWSRSAPPQAARVSRPSPQVTSGLETAAPSGRGLLDQRARGRPPRPAARSGSRALSAATSSRSR
ncbi:DUF222 domain-containing protein, partial [Agrococcus lahaulensis]